MSPAAPEPVAYLNGELLPFAAARLPLDDAGFIFGATVSDLCRTFNRRLFRLTEHVTRFLDSCRSVHIDLSRCTFLPNPHENLMAIAERLVATNAGNVSPGKELALVMFATPGPVDYYQADPGPGMPTVGVHTFPLPLSRYAPFFRDGVDLVIPLTRHVPRRTIDPRIKHRSRLHWWLAEQETRQLAPAGAPNAIALLLESAGRITETAVANFLAVCNGVVTSPPRTSILSGVSLQITEDLCASLDIPFQERPLGVNDCLAADEALLCGTAFCLAGVRSIDGNSLPWPGPIFERLLGAWNGQTGLDIRAQILAQG